MNRIHEEKKDSATAKKCQHFFFFSRQLCERTNQWIVVLSRLPGSHVGLESEICESGWNAGVQCRWSKMPFGVVSV